MGFGVCTGYATRARLVDVDGVVVECLFGVRALSHFKRRSS